MARNSLRLLLVLSLTLLCIGFGACSGLTESDKPAVKSWWLVPYTGVAQVKAPDSVSTVIVSMSVVPGLDTDRILALTGDSELKPFSGARWVDSLPELTESLVSRSLEESGRFEPVTGRGGSSVRPCDLELELREFYATLDSSGQTRSVHVAISGRYQCESEQPLPIQLKTSIPVHDSRMRVIIAAFQQAMDETTRNLLQKLP
jgi:ABC-type uncharacterized transport system auxiliary subunit